MHTTKMESSAHLPRKRDSRQRDHEDKRVVQPESLVRPENDHDGQDKRALELERQGQRKACRSMRRLMAQRQRKPPQRAGRIQAVALGKHAAV